MMAHIRKHAAVDLPLVGREVGRRRSRLDAAVLHLQRPVVVEHGIHVTYLSGRGGERMICAGVEGDPLVTHIQRGSYEMLLEILPMRTTA